MTVAPPPATSADPRLPYAPPPPAHRRRWFRRIVFGVPVLFLAVFLYQLGPAAWRHVQAVYWKRQCEAFTPPNGLVIYDDDPARLSAVLARPGYVSRSRAVGTSGLALLELRPWKSYFGNAAPVVFIHRRTSPSGKERFVAIQFTAVGSDPTWRRLVFSPYVENTASYFSLNRPALSTPSPVNGLMMFRQAGDGTRVLAGTPDPADASHFTIDYVHNNVPGTIDGWLNDDDSVTLAPRAGQVARATPGHVWWSPGGAPMASWVDRQGGTYDVATKPIPPHAKFTNPPIDASPPRAGPASPATAPSTTAPVTG